MRQIRRNTVKRHHFFLVTLPKKNGSTDFNMFEKQLSFDDLDISDNELFVQMGYGNATPDAAILQEVEIIKQEVRAFLRPRFGFVTINGGQLDTEAKTLRLGDTLFNVGRIITAQIRGSEAYALFVATSGEAFENFQRKLEAEGDMLRVFIADSLGSIIAEKTADIMERWLQVFINSKGWRHTNRFSPGYCGWNVSQQQLLFPLLGVKNPCGIRLSDSSLMVPIKSVSGIIGLGPNVKKLEYTCGLCDYAKCYKRRKKK